MADEKTILRELSVLAGVGLAREGLPDNVESLTPRAFAGLAIKYCSNISDCYDELIKIENLPHFDSSLLSIIKNGFCIGRYIHQKLALDGKLRWSGSEVKSLYPDDITIGNQMFSLKEDSYILKNPAFSDYLNALTQPNPPFIKIHVFRHFSPNEFNDWFNYSFGKLVKNVHSFDYKVIYSYKNKYNIIYDKEYYSLIFSKYNKGFFIDLTMKVSELSFNQAIPNDIVEHTFSKWIKDYLEKSDETYLELKRNCSKKAGEEIKQYVSDNFNPDIESLSSLLQIYEDKYYYAKCVNETPLLCKVPSYHECEIKIKNIDYKVPKSQLNLWFTFEVDIMTKDKKIKHSNNIDMHVECRYSHGQFNGIPEAKLYCHDQLAKIYEPI